jgi:hypothetical protein
LSEGDVTAINPEAVDVARAAIPTGDLLTVVVEMFGALGRRRAVAGCREDLEVFAASICAAVDHGSAAPSARTADAEQERTQ